VTHDQTEALTFADKVVVMYDGRVVQIGTPQELFERPEHTFVGYFIGSPGMNTLDAEISGKSARIGGASIDLGQAYEPKGEKIEIGVRPEFVRLSEGGDGLPAVIERVEDVGRHKIVRLKIEGQHGSRDINAIASEEDAIPSSSVTVNFDVDQINVYADDWRVARTGELSTDHQPSSRAGEAA
jgi:glycerol transport system ATP-binding protein